MEKTKRQSNFELLRILAMVMIILFHVQIHGPQPILTADNAFFASPMIYKRLLLFEVGIPLGMIGNGLFMVISGYFMNAKTNIDTGKISKKLLLQLGFATVVLMMAYFVWIHFFRDEKQYWETITLGDFNSGWWFVGYYMVVIVVAKVFLNRLVEKLSQAQFKSLLLTILAVTQFSWTGGLMDGLTGGLRTACIGVCFFLMGSYIARYNPFRNVRLYTIFLVIFATYAIRFLLAHNMVYKAIDDYWKSNSEGNFIQLVQGYANHEITVVILVVCFFELFRRWNIPYSKIINFIGKSTLMIYFIHENVFFRSFYRNDSWMETLGESWGAYCIKWLQWTALGFALGLLAYAIFTALGRLLPKMRILFVRQNVD